MSNDLEAATDRVFAAMDDYRTGEAVHATRQVAKALARAALEGVREKALREAAEVAGVFPASYADGPSLHVENMTAARISAAIRALIGKAD
jgi:LmbE family N-acetylglucosaminyl deacetylase